MDTQRIRKIMRILRVVPTPKPVIVQRRPILPVSANGVKAIECGYTFFRPRVTVILINSGLPSIVQEETLVHEYAHAVAGVEGLGPEWGIAYARVWRAYAPP